MAGGKKMALQITSTAFSEGGMIPKPYTCDGTDVSPDLSWTGVPEDTKSLALICDDPDAPVGNWVHWVLFNIPAGESGILSEVAPEATLPNGAKHGTNDFRRLGYGGPCPPEELTGIFLSFLPLTRFSAWEAVQPKPRLKRPCKAIFWQKRS